MDTYRDYTDLRVSPERQSFLDLHWPLVKFEIPAEKSIWGYQSFLLHLLKDFMLWLDARNESDAIAMENHSRWNEEGGIGLYVEGVYICHCKMYLFDGGEKSRSFHSGYRPWGGVLFRDHTDVRSNTLKVFLIADTLERFLQNKRVTHTRENALKTHDAR